MRKWLGIGDVKNRSYRNGSQLVILNMKFYDKSIVLVVQLSVMQSLREADREDEPTHIVTTTPPLRRSHRHTKNREDATITNQTNDVGNETTHGLKPELIPIHP